MEYPPPHSITRFVECTTTTLMYDTCRPPPVKQTDHRPKWRRNPLHRVFLVEVRRMLQCHRRSSGQRSISSGAGLRLPLPATFWVRCRRLRWWRSLRRHEDCLNVLVVFRHGIRHSDGTLLHSPLRRPRTRNEASSCVEGGVWYRTWFSLQLCRRWSRGCQRHQHQR